MYDKISKIREIAPSLYGTDYAWLREMGVEDIGVLTVEEVFSGMQLGEVDLGGQEAASLKVLKIGLSPSSRGVIYRPVSLRTETGVEHG